MIDIDIVYDMLDDRPKSDAAWLMARQTAATLRDLKSKNVKASEMNEQRWGKLATFALPGGGKIGVYQPNHPSPLKLKS